MARTKAGSTNPLVVRKMGLALVVEHLQYIPLGELPHVPDKARRDAPTIAVANL